MNPLELFNLKREVEELRQINRELAKVLSELALKHIHVHVGQELDDLNNISEQAQYLRRTIDGQISHALDCMMIKRRRLYKELSLYKFTALLYLDHQQGMALAQELEKLDGI